MIKDQKIEEFLNAVGSSAPTPGGGAVAAITGATAASLVEMVASLTKTEDTETFKIKGSKARQELLKLADEDAKAFDGVMDVFRISKDDPTRKEKIQSAFKGAAETPLKIAQIAKEINVLAKEIQKIGNKNALSDAKTATYLSEAAKKSAIENVKINLLYIKDEAFVRKMEAALASLK